MHDFIFMDQKQKFARPQVTRLMTTRGHAYLRAQVDLAKSKALPAHEAQNEFLNKVDACLRAIENLPVFNEHGYIRFLNDIDPEETELINKMQKNGYCLTQMSGFYCLGLGSFSKNQNYTSWDPKNPKTVDEAREWLRLASAIAPNIKQLAEFAQLHQVAFHENVLAASLRIHKKLANNSLSFKMRSDTSLDHATSFVIFQPSSDKSRPSGYINSFGGAGVFSAAKMFETSGAAAAYLKQRSLEKSCMVVEVETQIKRVDFNPGNVFSEELTTCFANLERKQLMDALEKSSTEELKRIVSERQLLGEADAVALKQAAPKKRAI